MSEELFFNDDGERAPFTATRISTFNRQQEAKGLQKASEEDGLDVVLVIQVPLKVERSHYGFGSYGVGGGGGGFGVSGSVAGVGSTDGAVMEYEMSESMDMPMSAPKKSENRSPKSDVEVAVIGTGDTEGPYREINNLAIERDHDFPIRVTVQFYKATSNGVVSKEDVAKVRRQIDRVYAEGDWVGSLVTGGVTDRPTESVAKPAEGARWARQPGWGWMK
jgi:hypothetical protein